MAAEEWTPTCAAGGPHSRSCWVSAGRGPGVAWGLLRLVGQEDGRWPSGGGGDATVQCALHGGGGPSGCTNDVADSQAAAAAERC